jgi:hypothetical protein
MDREQWEAVAQAAIDAYLAAQPAPEAPRAVPDAARVSAGARLSPEADALFVDVAAIFAALVSTIQHMSDEHDARFAALEAQNAHLRTVFDEMMRIVGDDFERTESRLAKLEAAWVCK